MALCQSMDVLIAFQVATTSAGARASPDIEAVRRWVPRLTMTNRNWGQTQPSNPGLRLACFMWGRPTYGTYYNKGGQSLYYNPSSYSAGNPFTGNLQQFKDEINWLESIFTSVSYVSYYNHAYVEPSLIMSKQMLIAGYDSHRTRILLYGTGTYYYYDNYAISTYAPTLRSYSTILISRTPEYDSQWVKYNVGYSQCSGGLATLPSNCWYSVQDSQNGPGLETRLDNMCDRSQNGWALAVVTSTSRAGSCPSYSTQTPCEADDACIWSNNQCQVSTSQNYCTQKTCEQQIRCLWNATLGACRKVSCPNTWTQTKCQSYSQWTWANRSKLRTAA